MRPEDAASIEGNCAATRECRASRGVEDRLTIGALASDLRRLSSIRASAWNLPRRERRRDRPRRSTSRAVLTAPIRQAARRLVRSASCATRPTGGPAIPDATLGTAIPSKPGRAARSIDEMAHSAGSLAQLRATGSGDRSARHPACRSRRRGASVAGASSDARPALTRSYRPRSARSKRGSQRERAGRFSIDVAGRPGDALLVRLARRRRCPGTGCRSRRAPSASSMKSTVWSGVQAPAGFSVTPRARVRPV